MKQPLFSGTGVALITPFRRQQETVDFTKLEALIEHIMPPASTTSSPSAPPPKPPP